MKKSLLLFICIAAAALQTRSQSTPNTLDVVSWNIEWFGASGNGPADNDLQESNVKKILRYLDADLVGLVEVVDTMRTRRLVDSLGSANYGYVISPYCTQATSPSGGAWLSGQKLAFIYKKSVFSNVTTRGLLRSSGIANANWASGRFPFMLSATVTINGISKDMNFIVIHAKAGSTFDDFTKRLGGAQEMKDTLDTQYNTANNLIIGDYNDALNTSIYTGSATSSYLPFVSDSTDSDHFKSVTFPLGASGQTSMINFPNVIDNHIITNEVEPFYVPGSAWIRTDILTVVPDYVTAHNTSDHYPVFSQYNLAGVVTGLPVVTAASVGFRVFPNPVSTSFYLQATKNLAAVTLSLYDMQGQLISTDYRSMISSGSTIEARMPALSRGIYFLHVQTGSQRAVVRLIHL